ncbi:MAG: ester cyclase [Solirubrobacteraceae bacterium]
MKASDAEPEREQVVEGSNPAHGVDPLFDAWEAAWSGGEPHAFHAICSAQVHYEDPLTPEPLEGVAALIRHAERLWDAFPDARLERLGPRLHDGQMVAAPCKLLATNREPLGALPATNRFVIVPIVFYCELERGLLWRVRAFYDLYGAAVQLGVLPARGTLGEKALLLVRGFGMRAGR